MNTTIYYFTGTGNSLKVARDLAERLDNCKLASIAKIWKENTIIPDTEKVGLIFPLYWMGLPKIIYDFVEKINLDKAKYFFIVITRGGSLRGGSLHQIKKLLKTKSKSLNAAFFITMIGNYIIGYDRASEEKQKKIFEDEKTNILKISKLIRDNLNTKKKEKLYFLWSFFNKRFRKKVNNKDIGFFSDEKCNTCAECVEICPMENIYLIDAKPQWQHKCQLCLACIQLCPQEAIQYGDKTKTRSRYHHPEITLSDIKNKK